MKLLYIYFVTFNLYLFGYLMAETKQVFIDPHAMFDESDIKPNVKPEQKESAAPSFKPAEKNSLEAEKIEPIDDKFKNIVLNNEEDQSKPSKTDTSKVNKNQETKKSHLKEEYAASCIANVFFKQYCKRMYSVLNEAHDGTNKNLQVSLKIELSYHQLIALKTYGDSSGDTGIQAAHATLSDVLLYPNPEVDQLLPHSDWIPMFDMESDSFLFSVLATFILMVSLKVFHHTFTVAHSVELVLKLLLVGFIASVFWNWVFLYQAEKAKRLAIPGIPEECMSKQQQSWYAVFTSWLFVPSDQCAKYHEQLYVKSFWEVSPMRAVAITITKFFLEPCELLAASVRRCFIALLDGLPIHLYPIILILVTFFITLLILVCGGYGISLPFLFTIGPQARKTSSPSELKQLSSTIQQMQIQLNEVVNTMSRLSSINQTPQITSSSLDAVQHLQVTQNTSQPQPARQIIPNKQPVLSLDETADALNNDKLTTNRQQLSPPVTVEENQVPICVQDRSIETLSASQQMAAGEPMATMAYSGQL